MSNEYWAIVAEEALGDAGIEATREQIETVAKWVESAHDGYAEYTGLDIVTSNFNADQQNKINDLEEQLQREKDSIPCPHCEGKEPLHSMANGNLHATLARIVMEVGRFICDEHSRPNIRQRRRNRDVAEGKGRANRSFDAFCK